MMSPELKNKVKLIRIIEDKIFRWEDDIGYTSTNKECAIDIAKKILEKFEINPLTK